MMSDNRHPSDALPAEAQVRRPADATHVARDWRKREEGDDSPLIAEAAPLDLPAAPGDATPPPDAAPAADSTSTAVGSAPDAPSATAPTDAGSLIARDDRSSPLLASGLGLLGVAGAATVGTVAVVAASSGDSKPPTSVTPTPEVKPKPDETPTPGTPQPGTPTPETPTPETPSPGTPTPTPGTPTPGTPDPGPSQPGTPTPGRTDTEDPDAPILTLAMDTGASDSDSVTSRATVRVGGLEPDAQWIYSVDGGRTWVNGVGNEIAADRFGADGAKEALVQQIDAAGNHGEHAQLLFTLDTLAPERPRLATSTGTALIGQNGAVVVNDLEAGAHIEYSLDAGQSWTASVDPRIAASVLGGEGERTIQVRQIDLAGNVGEASTRTLTVDLTPPTAMWTTLRSEDSDGNSVSRNITVPGDIYVYGFNFEDGFRREYSWNGTDWKTLQGRIIGQADQPGDGLHQLWLRHTDPAGNETVSTREFTIDGTAPLAPRLELVNDTGTSATDLITADGTLRIVGLEKGARWELSSNRYGHTALVGTSEVIPQSLYDRTSNTQVVVTLRQIDEAGNFSPTARFDFTLDPVAAAAARSGVLDV